MSVFTNTSVFPAIIDEELYDGQIIPICSFCKNRIRKRNEKCISHLETSREIGKIFECPYGYGTVDYGKEKYCSLNIYEFSNDSKIRKRLLPQDNPISATVLKKTKVEDILLNENGYKEVTTALNNTLHDVNKLSGFIIHTVRNDDINENNYKEKITTIRQWSQLIKSRLNLYDISSNKLMLTQGEKLDRDIFKLFYAIYKSFRALPNERNLSITIGYNKEIRVKINVYSTYQLLPYIFIDNAVKYAPNNTSIKIHFDLSKKGLLISCKSVGPTPLKGELSFLSKRGYRSKSPFMKDIKGSGIGLSVARDICSKNDTKFTIVDPVEHDSIMGYSYFEVLLFIDKTHITKY